jgi:hypothetical protein
MTHDLVYKGMVLPGWVFVLTTVVFLLDILPRLI